MTTKIKVLLLCVCLVFASVFFTACTINDDSADQSSVNTSPTPAKPENDLDETELIKIVADRLGVPEETDITYVISEKYYWEAGEVYYKDVAFYKSGKCVAGAFVDPRDGELLRNILMYSVNNE